MKRHSTTMGGATFTLNTTQSKSTNMKDLFDNTGPVQIEINKWWFNGRIIQRQDHPILPKYISFSDDDSPFVNVHNNKKDAVKFAIDNPCTNPLRLPKNYL